MSGAGTSRQKKVDLYPMGWWMFFKPQPPSLDKHDGSVERRETCRAIGSSQTPSKAPRWQNSSKTTLPVDRKQEQTSTKDKVDSTRQPGKDQLLSQPLQTGQRDKASPTLDPLLNKKPARATIQSNSKAKRQQPPQAKADARIQQASASSAPVKGKKRLSWARDIENSRGTGIQRSDARIIVEYDTDLLPDRSDSRRGDTRKSQATELPRDTASATESSDSEDSFVDAMPPKFSLEVKKSSFVNSKAKKTIVTRLKSEDVYSEDSGSITSAVDLNTAANPLLNAKTQHTARPRQASNKKSSPPKMKMTLNDSAPVYASYQSLRKVNTPSDGSAPSIVLISKGNRHYNIPDGTTEKSKLRDHGDEFQVILKKSAPAPNQDINRPKKGIDNVECRDSQSKSSLTKQSPNLKNGIQEILKGPASESTVQHNEKIVSDKEGDSRPQVSSIPRRSQLSTTAADLRRLNRDEPKSGVIQAVSHGAKGVSPYTEIQPNPNGPRAPASIQDSEVEHALQDALTNTARNRGPLLGGENEKKPKSAEKSSAKKAVPRVLIQSPPPGKIWSRDPSRQTYGYQPEGRDDEPIVTFRTLRDLKKLVRQLEEEPSEYASPSSYQGTTTQNTVQTNQQEHKTARSSYKRPYVSDEV